MAFAGNYIGGRVDTFFVKIKYDTTRQTERINLDDPDALDHTLQTNIRRFRRAGKYDLDIKKSIWDYKKNRKDIKMKLKRGSGKSNLISETDKPILEEF